MKACRCWIFFKIIRGTLMRQFQLAASVNDRKAVAEVIDFHSAAPEHIATRNWPTERSR
jgi:hypothetical protein